MKKIILVLCTVMLLFCASRVGLCASEPNTPAESQSNKGFSFTGDGQGKWGNDVDSGELFKKTLIAVMIVLVFGAAAIYISKKLLPRITKMTGKEIRVIETVHLAPRRSVHLLEIGKRRIVVGSTNESITKLAELNFSFSDIELPSQEIDNREN